jgi:SCY1-like protein 1
VPTIKPLRLAANNNISSVAALVEHLTEEVASEANPWGTDDLIDVNADDGDWSMHLNSHFALHSKDFLLGAFETAPTIIQPKPVLATHVGKLTVAGAVTAARPLSNGPLGIDPRTRPSSLQNPRLPDTRGYNPSPLSPSELDSQPYAGDPGREGNIIHRTPPPSASPNVANMTKEEKTAEMAKRKEERKNVCDGMIVASFLELLNV